MLTKIKPICIKIKWSIVVVLLLCSIWCLFENNVNGAVVEPTQQFYVNDYANVLSEETKRYIINTNVDLQQKTGAQIVVVTVNSLDGMSIENYANTLFRKFGIGDKEKNNGLLLLCSYGDREFRVEVGYGLEGILPDGKTGRMQDKYIIPYLKDNNFDEGIKNGYSAFLGEVAKEYGVTINEAQVAEKVEAKSNIGWSILEIIFSIIFIVIITMRFRGPFIFIGGGHHGGFGGFGRWKFRRFFWRRLLWRRRFFRWRRK